MTKIPTFGFSAFLKLICLSERPQKTAVRGRHRPSKGSGYDYHKSLRTRVQQLATHSRSINDIMNSIGEITKQGERESVKQGLARFEKWRLEIKGNITFCDRLTFESPKGLFRITFGADFVIDMAGRQTAVHVWNTNCKLSRNLVYGALSLVAENWEKEDQRPSDFAVLSLQDGQFYAWSDEPNRYKNVGHGIVAHLERLCQLSREEYELPSVQKRDEPPHPSAPE